MLESLFLLAIIPKKGLKQKKSPPEHFSQTVETRWEAMLKITTTDNITKKAHDYAQNQNRPNGHMHGDYNNRFFIILKR